MVEVVGKNESANPYASEREKCLTYARSFAAPHNMKLEDLSMFDKTGRLKGATADLVEEYFSRANQDYFFANELYVSDDKLVQSVLDEGGKLRRGVDNLHTIYSLSIVSDINAVDSSPEGELAANELITEMYGKVRSRLDKVNKNLLEGFAPEDQMRFLQYQNDINSRFVNFLGRSADLEGEIMANQIAQLKEQIKPKPNLNDESAVADGLADGS